MIANERVTDEQMPRSVLALPTKNRELCFYAQCSRSVTPLAPFCLGVQVTTAELYRSRRVFSYKKTVTARFLHAAHGRLRH
jgi:hypothetical protein